MIETTRIVPGGASTSPPMKPDLIPGLVIDRQIGSGATARVYLAVDSADPTKRYAVKFLSAVLSHQEDSLRRWKREAEVLLRLDHPNIVRGVRHGMIEDRPYLVMEYLQGESLADRLRREEKLSEPEVLAVALACLSALDAAHRQGVIHRDVKPANIVRLNDGSIKLTDFGLAHDESDDSLTMAGAIVGTPVYLSPEQATGGEVTIQSDLYALGTTLYHLASGRPPFKELNTSLLLTRKITDDVPDVRHHEPSVSGVLAFLISELCQRSPGSRPRTPSAALKLLDQLQSGELATPCIDISESQRRGPQPMTRESLNSEEVVLKTLVGDETINTRPLFLQRGEVLFYEDDASLECYILMSGRVEILKAGRPIATIEQEGAFIGEMSPLRKAPRSATVVAREDSVVLMIPESGFHDFLTRHPDMAILLARSLAERLESTNIQLASANKKIGALSRHVTEMTGIIQERKKGD